MKSGPVAACVESAAGEPGSTTAPRGRARRWHGSGPATVRAGQAAGGERWMQGGVGAWGGEEVAADDGSCLEEVTLAGTGEGVSASAREAGPSGREQGGSRPGRDGVGVLKRVGIIVIRDDGTAPKRVTRAEDDDREGAARDTQKVGSTGRVLARVVGEAGVSNEGRCASALVVRVDAQVETNPGGIGRQNGRKGWGCTRGVPSRRQASSRVGT